MTSLPSEWSSFGRLLRFQFLPLKLAKGYRDLVASVAFLVAHKAFLSSSHEVQLTVSSFSCQHHDSKSPLLSYSRSTVGRQSTDGRPRHRLSVDRRSNVGDKMSADCRLTHRPTVSRLSVDGQPTVGRVSVDGSVDCRPTVDRQSTDRGLKYT